MSELKLIIATPQKKQPPLTCDSVRLMLCDDAKGRGGGEYGIHPGHIKALIALQEGPLHAFLHGEPILEGACGAGFASVEGDTVTVVVESFLKK